MSQTVRIDRKHILSRVHVSVRPRHFLYKKNTQNYREYRIAYATVYLNEAPTGHSSPAEQAKKGINFVMVGCTPTHRTATTCTVTAVGGCVCKRVRACVRDVFAIYDNII